MNRTARLGLFIIGALAVLFAGIFLIGRKDFLFSHTYHLRSEFDNVAGLQNGAEVRVGGVHVGTVEGIHMPEKAGGKVAVVMNLESSTRKVLKKDSIASIQTEGLLGNKYLTVSFGSPNSQAIHEDDTIRSERPLDFSDLLKKSDQVLDTTNAALRNVEDTTGNLKSIADKVDKGQGTLGTLINDKHMYQQANQAATSMAENMEALKGNWLFHGFFKDRGYTDQGELAKNELTKVPSGYSAQQKFVVRTKDVFDDPNHADIKHEKKLESVGKALEGKDFKLVMVEAFRGVEGSKDVNLQLSRAQAFAVRNYLVNHFKIDDTRVKTKGNGETKSNDENADRIEIVIYG